MKTKLIRLILALGLGSTLLSCADLAANLDYLDAAMNPINAGYPQRTYYPATTYQQQINTISAQTAPYQMQSSSRYPYNSTIPKQTGMIMDAPR